MKIFSLKIHTLKTFYDLAKFNKKYLINLIQFDEDSFQIVSSNSGCDILYTYLM